MGFKDIFKSSFLDQASQSFSVGQILLILAVTALIGIYIFFVYRATSKKAFYSKNFAISLVLISLITAIIIMTIQSSIVISLGMVGALSIVRFRTAIKDPMDLAFLFWSISIGIICGANLFTVAIIGSLVITIVMVILFYIPNAKPMMLLLVNAEDKDIEKKLLEVLTAETKVYTIKSRNISSNGINMVIEVKTDDDAALLSKVSALPSVKTASLLSHDGEVTV